MNSSCQSLYSRLYSSLPTSTGAHRKILARRVAQDEVNLKKLLPLAGCERGVASRFLWLLSDVAEINPEKVFEVLPDLFAMREQILHAHLEHSLSKYWSLLGIPKENEGEAVDLLFQWLVSPNSNVTVKRHSFLALKTLTQKYPELQSELDLCVEDQLGKTGKSFDKLINKFSEHS
mgnify:CR=1 FL=1